LEERVAMDEPVKILHIDPDYQVTLFLSRSGISTHSQITLEQAVNLLKTEKFDLILSEPHHQAIMNPQGPLKKMDLESFYAEYRPRGYGKDYQYQ
jgi:hypothetical protein